MNKKMIKIREKYFEIKDINEKKSKTLSFIRLIVFTIILFLIYLNLSKDNIIFLLLLVIMIFLFFIIVFFHFKINKKINKIKFFLSLINRYERRCTDDWKKEHSGYVESDSYISNDLNILNGDSLLKYLDFTSSLGGKNNLIASLTLENFKFNKDDIEKMQQSIIELNSMYEFILEFQYILSKIDKIKEINFKKYFYFFDRYKKHNNLELFSSLILSFLTILSLVLSLTGIIKPYLFIILFFVQLGISYFYMMIYRKEFDDISMCSRYFSELRNVYNFIDNQDFNSKLNYDLKMQIHNGISILNDIKSISNINSFRLNFISYIIFNVFFSLNFILLYKYKKLLENRNDDFKNSVYALEEFEKIISFTTIGIVKKNICMPELVDDYKLEIEDGKHILINEDKCISNSFSCSKDINIITGSNMSGKTSFMKMISTNLILAYNGCYVNAKSFSCPIAKIFTSINVQDNITKGISTFYGELIRIKDMIDYSKKNKKMIVFIDEIFKGTNYNDRIFGAKEILKQLSCLDVIVFLTTHDFELCDVDNIKNYYFEEKYTNKKIVFDYKIRKGKCKTTNAKYLMCEMGIINNIDQVERGQFYE